jgi:hypothetical protein
VITFSGATSAAKATPWPMKDAMKAKVSGVMRFIVFSFVT